MPDKRLFSTTTQYGDDTEICIITEPVYMPALQIVGGGEFCFSYNITIRNQGDTAARLVSRRWLITDGDNETRTVEGDGVVGEQPRIVAGGEFSYTSYVDFPTPNGCMEGAYIMELDNGEVFEAAIGVFSLSVPGKLH